MVRIALFFYLLIFIHFSIASIGDRSQFYRQCLIECYYESCKHNVEFEISAFTEDDSLSWTCEENCRYSCMWNTVDFFIKRGYSVPQFHGKWPFLRLFGLQEPASVIFSVFNFYAHIMMYKKFRKEIRPSFPLFPLWNYCTLVCLNGWFWSALFHARDKPFTEKMDYSCAFTIVVTLLYCILIRIFYKKNNKIFIVTTCGYISILYTHLSHLWSGKINYGYNMKLNIFFGFLTFIITLIWWYRNYKKIKHVYLIGWFNILTVIVTLLEVADFPPLFWIFDAHSLWHASTAPLTYFLYKFMILDCHYLRKKYSQVIIENGHFE